MSAVLWNVYHVAAVSVEAESPRQVLLYIDFGGGTHLIPRECW